MRSTASGVRSSCAASDANLRSVADARSRRSSNELISAVSRATSSATGGTVSRELRFVGPIASSSALTDSIGRSARPASRYPPPTQSISTIGTISNSRLRRPLDRFLDEARLHAALQVRDLAVVHHRNDREPELVVADDRRMRRAALGSNGGGIVWTSPKFPTSPCAVTIRARRPGPISVSRLSRCRIPVALARAAALDLVGGVLGLLQQRRVQRAELLALEQFYRRDRRDQQNRRQHRGPVNR